MAAKNEASTAPAQVVPGKEKESDINAIRAELIRRGRSIYNPVAYPPPGRNRIFQTMPASEETDAANSLVLEIIVKDGTGQMGRTMAIIDDADRSSTISRGLVRTLKLTPDERPVQVELESPFVSPDKITLQLFFSRLIIECEATIVDYFPNDTLIIGIKDMF